jgi:hypothetical protein
LLSRQLSNDRPQNFTRSEVEPDTLFERKRVPIVAIECFVFKVARYVKSVRQLNAGLRCSRTRAAVQSSGGCFHDASLASLSVTAKELLVLLKAIHDRGELGTQTLHCVRERLLRRIALRRLHPEHDVMFEWMGISISNEYNALIFKQLHS